MKLRLLTLIVAVTLMPMALLARNYDMTFTDEKPEAALQIIKKATGYEFVYNKASSPALTTALSLAISTT